MNNADISRLDRIRASLAPEDAEWLAARLEPKWLQRERRLYNRDGTIRLASLILCVGMPPKTAARHLSTTLTRYLAVAWPRQAHLDCLPFSAPAVHVFMHRVARFNDGKPVGESQILNILSGGRQR